MPINVGVVEVTVLPDTSKLSAAMTGVGSSAGKSFSRSFASQLSSAGSSLTSAGKKLTRSVSLPLVAVGAVAVHSALQFNQAFSRMSVLAGNLGMSVQDAKKHVEALAISTGQDPQKLAEALYFVASAGLKTSQVMPVLEQSAKAAAVGMGDASTIAQTLTSVLNAYANTGLTAANATNILTEAVKVGKAEPADLAANIGQVIPIASQLGVSFDQVAAGIEAVTNTGTSAARAGTAFRFLLSSFLKPTTAATTALKDYGFTVAGLQRGLADPNIGILGTLEMLSKKFDLSTVAGKAAFASVVGGARGMSFATSLIGKNLGSVQKAFADVGKSAQDNSKVFDKAFKTISATPAQQLARAMSELKVAGIELGNQLIPILVHDIIPAIESAVKWFRNLSPESKKLTLQLAALAIVAGPLLRLSGAILSVAGAAAKLFGLGSAGAAGSSSGGWLASGLKGLAAGTASKLATGATLAVGAYSLGSISGVHMPDNVKQISNLLPLYTNLLKSASAADKDLAKQQEVLATRLGADVNVFKLAGAAGISYADALNQMRSGLTATTPGIKDYLSAISLATDISDKQRHAVLGLIAVYNGLKGPLDKVTVSQVRNLLAQGDLRDALALLRDKVDEATKHAHFFSHAMDDTGNSVRAAGVAARDAAANKFTVVSHALDDVGNSARIAALQNDHLRLAISRLHSKKIAVDVAGNATSQLDLIAAKLHALSGGQFTIDVHTGAKRGFEQGGFIPGAATGGYVANEQLLRVGEHHKPEMILPLTDPAGHRELVRALHDAGGSGALRLVQGQMSIDDSGQAWFRGLARQEIDDQAAHDRTLARMH